MTFQLPKAFTVKTAAALLLGEILFFAIGVMPEHVSTLGHHDHCNICALIQHPPVVETGLNTIICSMHPSSVLRASTAESTPIEPIILPGPSRAPPSLI